MLIRVDPVILKQNSGSISGIGSSINSSGQGASGIAQGAPSYDGQFGPRVQAIGHEALARAQGLLNEMNSISSQLQSKAQAFDAADRAGAAGFTSINNGAQISILDPNWIVAPIDYIKSIIKLGWLFGSVTFTGLLGTILWGSGISSGNGQGLNGTPLGNSIDQKDILNVPFVSQWNGYNGGGNCGPASVTMAINTFGKNVKYENVVAIIPKDAQGHTDFQSSQVKGLLKNNGLQEQQVNTINEVDTQISKGHPVIIAVDNTKPGATGPYTDTSAKSGFMQKHIVVVTGIERDASGKIIGVYINDPLAVKSGGSTGTQAAPDLGTNFHLTLDQFNAAAGTNLYAVAIEPAQ